MADSSFYICFLDDITREDALIRMITHAVHSFIAGRVVGSEVMGRERTDAFKKVYDDHVGKLEFFDYGELLRPLFSVEEIDKGENEVIVIGYILHSRGEDLCIVLDERSARRFVESNFVSLARAITGTVGFVEACGSLRKVFTREEAISLLELIRRSTFWVDAKIVDGAIGRLGGQEDG